MTADSIEVRAATMERWADQSMISVERPRRATRYRLLETIR
jgi:hypothetical protein